MKDNCPERILAEHKLATTTRWLLGLYVVLLPSLIAWGAWLTNFTLQSNYDLRMRTSDRFSTAMFIDVQQELRKKNNEVEWLTPAEIRAIQRRNLPYEIINDR